MTRCAELLQNEVPIDFVDINIGCPIDLVFKQVQALYKVNSGIQVKAIVSKRGQYQISRLAYQYINPERR